MVKLLHTSAIRVPSGDQAGSKSKPVEVGSLARPVPSGFITSISHPPFFAVAKAIFPFWPAAAVSAQEKVDLAIPCPAPAASEELTATTAISRQLPTLLPSISALLRAVPRGADDVALLRRRREDPSDTSLGDPGARPSLPCDLSLPLASPRVNARLAPGSEPPRTSVTRSRVGSGAKLTHRFRSRMGVSLMERGGAAW